MGNPSHDLTVLTVVQKHSWRAAGEWEPVVLLPDVNREAQQSKKGEIKAEDDVHMGL